MLPSQTARPVSARSHMYRRPKRRRATVILTAVVLLGIVVVLIKWWGGAANPNPAEASIEPAAALEPVNSAKKNQTPAQPKTERQPQSLQGAGSSRLGPATSGVTMPDGIDHKISMGARRDKSSPSTATATNKPPTPAGAPPAASALIVPPAQPKSVDGRTQMSTSGAPPSTATTQRAMQRLQLGLDLIKQNKPVEARRMFSSVLESTSVSPTDAETARTELAKLNQRLVFGAEVVSGDPFAKPYLIEAGDSLAKLPKKLALKVDWRFLQRINGLSSPERIRAGQRIKIITGPFHAVIHKRSFRMDLYMGDSDDRVYVCSFPVGLGEFDSTPEGVYVVKPGSKMVDPAWTNPRTGEHFASKDPKNPLGRYWIGLIGDSDNIRGLEGYGIHGTIEPESIGQMKSMGCVRMRADDIALVYELLLENVSRVTIRGDE
jgi:hypothetical protein